MTTPNTSEFEKDLPGDIEEMQDPDGYATKINLNPADMSFSKEATSLVKQVAINAFQSGNWNKPQPEEELEPYIIALNQAADRHALRKVVEELMYLRRMRDMNGNHYFRSDKIDERIAEIDKQLGEKE